MAALEYRPLTTGELADRMFQLYRRHFPQLFLLGCLIRSIPLVIGLAMTAVPVPSDFWELVRHPEWVAPILALALATLLSYFVCITLGQAALVRLVSDLYLGREATILEAMASVKGRIVASLWTESIKTVVLAAAFLPSALPFLAGAAWFSWTNFGIWMAIVMLTLVLFAPFLVLFVRWLISMPAVMLDGLSGVEALRRSARLTRFDPGKGFWYWGETRLSLFLLPVVVVQWLTALISAIPVLLVQLPAMASGQMKAGGFNVPPGVLMLTHLLDFVGQSLVFPLFTILGVLFYYDVRARREGLDVEWLAAKLRDSISDSPSMPAASHARS